MDLFKVWGLRARSSFCKLEDGPLEQHFVQAVVGMQGFRLLHTQSESALFPS